MTLNSSGIGLILVSILGGILVQVRAAYLDRRSRKIEIDESSHFQLRPAKWAYSIVILALGMGGGTALVTVIQGDGIVRLLIGGVFSAASIWFGIWMFGNLRQARLTIGDGKVTYTDGSEVREVMGKDVGTVTIYWSWFLVRLHCSSNGPKQAFPMQGFSTGGGDLEHSSIKERLFKKPPKSILIPATMEKSEITFAFLRQAAAKNADLKVR